MKASSKFSSRALFRPIGLGLIVVLALVACAPTAAPASAPSAPVPTKAPPTAPATNNSITGIVWQWTSVTEAGKTTTVPNPASYTIIFNTDGTTTGQVDCNTFKGTYSQQNGFTISVTPDVMAACGTLDSQYLDLLNHVAAGGPDGSGGLALETAGGAQRMTFKNGGAAPAAPAPSNTITDINWQWLSVKNKTTNTTTTVPNPENYTIIFRTDGTFTGKADCNNISGTYSRRVASPSR